MLDLCMFLHEMNKDNIWQAPNFVLSVLKKAENELRKYFVDCM